VSEQVELAAETAGAVVGALVEETGVAGPAREYADYVKARVGMRYAPKLAERAMATAEKIKQSGLPYCAYGEIREPLVRRILEGAAEEDDPDLRQRWENLLANAVTSGSAEVRAAFPRILGELEPEEAVILDRGVEVGPNEPMRFRPPKAPVLALVNLSRLGLVASSGMDSRLGMEVSLTPLGWAFARACREPAPQD
jgi:hypothetical protein